MIRHGAGVLALNPAGQVLLHRRARGCGAGCWSVPGGKAEPGELYRRCARREFREETGLEVARLTPLAVVTAAHSCCGEEWATHWYAGTASGTPRLSAESTELRWADWGALPQPLWEPFFPLLLGSLVARLLGAP